MLNRQRDMRSVASRLNVPVQHLLQSIVPRLRHTSSSHPAAAAAEAQAAAVASNDQNEQQHTPHVSVLLQEVLHNLNHMPIKVGVFLSTVQ